MATVATRIDWAVVRERMLGKRDPRHMPPWVKLPGLPNSLMECVRKANDPEIGIKELGKILERDAGLSGQLLRHVNSAASGFSHACSTPGEAMTRLGIRGSVLYLLTEGMKHVMKSSRSKVLHVPSFWCENLERGLFARHIARLLGADEEMAYAGGLLCDCLLPVLTNQASKSYLRFLGADDGKRVVDFEDVEFGWDHALATALIFHGWQFDAELVCCVGLHHKGETLLTVPDLRNTSATAVAIATLLPEQLRQEPGCGRRLQKIAETLPGFDLLEIAEQVDQEFREAAPEADNPRPLLGRLKKALK